MARKPHLAAMPDAELEVYRRRLRTEQAAVLAEIAMRQQAREIDPHIEEKLNFGWSEKVPPQT